MLKGLGYRITSTFRPGDFGYHGSGQAIDVAPAVNMPYDNELERQWSSGVRAIFGIPDSHHFWESWHTKVVQNMGDRLSPSPSKF